MTADAAPSNTMLDLVIEGAWRVEIRDLWLDASSRMANGLHVLSEPAPAWQDPMPLLLASLRTAAGRLLPARGDPWSQGSWAGPGDRASRHPDANVPLTTAGGGRLDVVQSPPARMPLRSPVDTDLDLPTYSLDLGGLLGAAPDPSLPCVAVLDLTVKNCRQQRYVNVATGLDALTVAAAGIRISGGFRKVELEGCCIDGVVRAADIKPRDGAGAGIDIHPDSGRLRYCHTTVVRGCSVHDVRHEVPPGGDLKVNEDMDGLKVLTLASAFDSTAIVEDCRFVNCEYRAIKTQVAATFVKRCSFWRAKRPGHVEIDAQWGQLQADNNRIVWRGNVAGTGVNRTCRFAYPRGPMNVVGNTFIYERPYGWAEPHNYPVAAVAAVPPENPRPTPDGHAGGADNPVYRVLLASYLARNGHGNRLDHVLVRDNVVEVVELLEGVQVDLFQFGPSPSFNRPCCALLSLTARGGGTFLAAFNSVPGCARALISLDSDDVAAMAPRFRGGLVGNSSWTETLGVLGWRGSVFVQEAWVGNGGLDDPQAMPDNVGPNCT